MSPEVRKERVDVRKNLRILKFFVVCVFLVLFTLGVVGIGIRFNFYITAWGDLENEVEVPIKSDVTGQIVQMKARNGQLLKVDDVIATIKDEKGEEHFIKSTVAGRFLSVEDVDSNSRQDISAKEIFGVVVADGVFFKALVEDTDMLDLKPGQNCIVRIRAYQEDNYPPIDGKVFYVSDMPVIESAKNYYPVFCQLNEAPAMVKLNKVGMGGFAKIQKGKSNIFNILFGRRERGDS